MKRILFLFLFMGMILATTSQAQTLVFAGSDTVGNGRTLTSSVITLGTTPVQIWPVWQVYVDYKSGTENCSFVAWHSLDNVRWDTIPGFYFNYDAEADGTVILTTESWETPLFTKYLKFTARGHTGTQSSTPKSYFGFKKLP